MIYLYYNLLMEGNIDEIEENFTLIDYKKDIFHNCSKLIFQENNENALVGDFNGIEIKIANTIDICYISFDIKPNYFKEFFKQFVEEWTKNIITPCHFVIPKLPTILIFNLLEKGPVILTGKRMGGVIASSLAFYILYFGKQFNYNYDNTFLKKKKNCLGVVTFGSPSFLTNLTIGKENKGLTSYFYHIKEEFDFIPVIIDFINKNHNYKDIEELFQKNEMTKGDENKLFDFINKNNLTKDKLIKTIKEYRKVPFGTFFMMKSSDSSLIFQNKYAFDNFYYYKLFNSKKISNLSIYKNLLSNIQFQKESLKYLENKNYQIELIKIIRRNNKSKIKENAYDSMKGVIKLKLTQFENNIFTPDIISKIKLISNNTIYTINNNNIYYDGDYITAYIDNLNEKINDLIITNNFGGEIKVKNIINILGSDTTRDMLKNNIEKLFLFPFFKLIEIFYISLNDKEKYDNLKKEIFGDNFDILNTILKPFEIQIKTIDELLFLSRPDIIGNSEKSFINEYINKYIGNELSNEQNYYLANNLKTFYMYAIQLQNIENINCLDSEEDSFAKIVKFPLKLQGDKKIKKLFMCNRIYFDTDNFIYDKFDESYIKKFFIEQLILESLQSLEKIIKKNLSGKDDNECKKYLNENIGKLYNELIIPNIYFILMLIISSIESGDEIKFNHDIDIEKVSFIIFYPFIFLKSKGKDRAKFEKDFKKTYSKNEIEEINMRNLFYRTKIKSIVDSNLSINHKSSNNIIPKKQKKIEFFEIISEEKNKNKINDFSKYSEKKIFGKKYYKTFLKLLNYNSNDFQEDIEISIYDNLKRENNNYQTNFLAIKEMMNNLINDEESKKGFLALVRQSYLLGKLRTNIVSNIYFLIIVL